MISTILAVIFVLFVFYVLIRTSLYKKFGFKLCAICTAVSTTWIALLILRFRGIVIDPLLIGILMGQSITGVMYLFENRAKKQGKNNIRWMKVFIILLGTALAYLLLTKGLSSGFITILIVSLIFTFILYALLNKKKVVVSKKYSKFQNKIKKLEDKFEHCCD